ncbi:hypothetical protein MLD38_031295 [Melastoma candidum]|uniref:Uncharacterized protein n=1 Tax=Melastoma candidum TaxID=119954 RepID=A0ACB9MP98_9MYRT|nr:hypothetical protein MLD38_031295 [Melastoma candidum]
MIHSHKPSIFLFREDNTLGRKGEEETKTRAPQGEELAIEYIPMDSLNSSGGGGDDEEYCSRPASGGAASIALSSFLMNGNAHRLQLLHQHDNTQQQQQPPPPPLPAFDDALPNFFDQLTRPGLPHRDHQLPFQLGGCVAGDELGVLLPPSARSTSANLTGALQLPAGLGYCSSPRQIRAGLTEEATNPPLDLATGPPKPVEGRPTSRNNNGVAPRRNPKKRTRASRRAPTTVLTTDTSNFHTMVQEFTGIPAPPFDAAATLFQRGRFDLFGTSFPGIAAGAGPSIPPSSPSYQLRPFAQRLLQSSPLPPTSSFISSTTTGDSTTAPSMELLFPLLSDDNNNINDPNNTSPSLLELGQALVKYLSSQDHEQGQEPCHHGPHSPGHLGPGGINNAIEEFRLGRQEGIQDRVRGGRDYTDAAPPSGQNGGATSRRGGGKPMESWICSSD